MSITDKINGLFAIILCIVLVCTSVIVGTPLKENTQIITKVIVIIWVIYLILYKFLLKKKYVDILKNIKLIDVCVIVLCISPWIPILFKTAVGIKYSKNIAIRYITVLIMYLLTRIIINQNIKYRKYFEIAIIMTGVISLIIGIDNMTFNFFSNLLQKIGIPDFSNTEKRMMGNFGYANTFAISLLIPLLLSIDLYMDTKNILYNCLNYIFMVGIILAYSRATLAVMIICFIIYVFLKKNNKNLKFIFNIVMLMVFSMLYTLIFSRYYQTKNIFIIYGSLFVLMFFYVFVVIIFSKLIKEEKTKTKFIARSLLVIFSIAIFIIVLVGLNFSKPLELFYDENQKEGNVYDIVNIEGNKKYVFDFDIEAHISNENIDITDIYEIQIIEKDKQNIETGRAKINFGNYKGIKTIEFITNENTASIFIVFSTSNVQEQKGLIVNELKINGKRYILEYLYLPSRTINRIKAINIKYILSQGGRSAYYKDALQLIRINTWTGIGGNCWKMSYLKIRSSNYSTSEVHSYPLQIFLEFGFVAILAYVFLLILILNNFKNINNKQIGTFISLMAIIMHSMIDFDLSFMNILMYFFILISLTVKKDKRRNII